MRQNITVTLSLLLTLLLGTGVSAQETINSFSATLDVNPDGSIEITETINVTTTGDVIKRGITRAITRNPIGEGKTGKFDYDVQRVRRDGREIDFFFERNGRIKTIYLGSKNKTLDPGTYTYELTYTSDDQIYFLEGVDEVRWHLIDTDTKLPVKAADITVRFPGGTNVAQAACYAGREGSQDQNCDITTDHNTTKFRLTRPLSPGEGMTVSVGAPAGTFARPAPPSALQRKGLWYTSLGSLLLALLYGVMSWSRHGRDPKGPEVDYEYYPPQGTSPASAYYQLNGGNGSDTLTASVTQLAIGGYIRVDEREEEGGFLGLGAKEYFVLHRTDSRPDSATLPPEQWAFYEQLFAKGDEVALNGKLNKNLGKATNAHADSLRAQHKDFLAQGGNAVKIWPLVGILITMLFVGVIFFGYAYATDRIVYVGSVIALILGLIAYALLIPKPSYEKVALRNQLKGLRKYLRLSRKKRAALPDAPKMTEVYYHQLLPYAIAFGQDNDWAESLDADIYNSSTRNADFYPVLLAGFGSQFNRNYNTTAFPASSGGGSSGGGFSGGGGSVGGGGGGTGGF